MKEAKTVYYHTEMDDFIEKNNSPIVIDEKYKFLHSNLLWNIISFIIYRIIMTPFAFAYLRLKFKLKIIGNEKIRESNRNGYFLFLNHTQTIGDAFLPTVISFPKKAYVIVNSDNVSIPFWGRFIKFIGPLPLPDTIKAWKNFKMAINTIILNGKSISIYPEAHVWDYCTMIRNYPSSSFKYPVELKCDSYAVTVTYKQLKNRKKPQMVVYIDGPFKANDTNVKIAQKDLRNKIYNVMCERAKNSNIDYIKYEKI